MSNYEDEEESAPSVMQERYATIAKTLDGLDLMALGRKMVQNAIDLKAASDAKALLEAEKEIVRLRLAEVMQTEKMPTFSVEFSDFSKRIRIEEVLKVSAPEKGGIAERVIEKLKDHAQGGLVKETVAPGTLKKFITLLRRKGEDGLPDPLLVELIGVGLSVTAKDQARFY